MKAIALLALVPAYAERVAGLASPDGEEHGHWTHPWGGGQAIRFVAPGKRR